MKILKFEQFNKINESTDSSNDLKLKIFLNNFPDKTTSWKDATDEIKTISQEIAEILKIENLNYKNLKTPSEWNTQYKKFILKNFQKLTSDEQKTILNLIENFLLNESLSPELIEELKENFENKHNLPFFDLKVSNLGSQKTLFLKLSFDKEENWYNKIYQNSKYAVFSIEESGKVILHNSSYKIQTTFRKFTAKDLNTIKTKINNWIEKVLEEIN